MRVLKVFLAGLLYGWLLRWIIDEIYLKDHLRLITKENEQLRDRIRLLERPKPLETQPIMQAAPAAKSAPAARRSAVQKDDMTKIKGIGPAMEKKLNAAGIHTYDQLSKLTTKQLQSIPGLSRRLSADSANLIAQARKLAQQKSKR